MRRLGIVISVVLMLLAALAPMAQEKPGNMGRVFVTVPRPGMAQQYEEGRKRHMDWHRKQGDTWTWDTWQVETGQASGAYVTGTFGHQWKDFDAWEAKYGKGDLADAAVNLSPSTGGGTNGFWIYLAEVSRPSDSKEPPKMAEVLHFMVNMDGEKAFNGAIRKIHEAIGKTNWPVRYTWYELFNGGEHPHFVLVFPRNSWAEMAPQEVSFEAMLEKAYGEAEAETILTSLLKSVHHESSEVLLYRPELSYRPGSK